MKKRLPNKSLILIDDANLYYGYKKHLNSMDYAKFYQWLNEKFDPLDLCFFGGVISKKMFLDRYPTRTLADFNKEKKKRLGFLKFLKKLGYKVYKKPVSSLYDSTSGDYKRKCNFDVEITIYALDKLREYRELVLCSGDGDFTKLLKYVKGHHRKATVIAHKDRINWELKKTANRVIFLEDIGQEIEMK